MMGLRGSRRGVLNVLRSVIGKILHHLVPMDGRKVVLFYTTIKIAPIEAPIRQSYVMTM